MTAQVTYTLSFPRAAQHLVHVHAVFERPPADDALTLFLPAWSPGSYMVRDYARHLEAVAAHDDTDAALAVVKTTKDTFVVAAPTSGRVHVHYDVYGREMSVRTNFIDSAFALVQGTATYLGCAALADAPHTVRVVLPPAWPQALCALPAKSASPAANGDANEAAADPAHLFVATSYDHLVDSPVLCGSPRVAKFSVGDAVHTLATIGADDLFDNAEAARLAQAVVGQNVALWQHVPYPHYHFYTIALGGGGGLEHRDGSVVMATATAIATETGKADFAGLLAHEHFHAWNIKRLRPRALGPFDYRAENYTPSLWVAEGVTAYYDDLQTCRAGIASPTDYLGRLAKSMQALQATPGRTLSSLTASSFDAWIKLYKRDENTDNTAVSYYLKGSLVAFLLDAEMRRRSDNERSLDDAMRAAYARYSGPRGFEEAEFRAVVAELVPGAWDAFFGHHVDGTGELEYERALSWYGLSMAHVAADASPAHRDHQGVLGATLAPSGAKAVVAFVARGTPAYDAGLNVDDEIIAVDERRVGAQDLFERLAARPAQSGPARLLIARFGRLQTLDVEVGPKCLRKVVLSISPEATTAQTRARERWLQALHGPATIAANVGA